MGKILLSTAYLPPVEYFSLIAGTDGIIIEKEESYLKQSYRNRCYILCAHGPLLLSVPVLEGSRHNVPVKEARIDYSKRWQQVHLRALMTAYRSSPFFDFYFEPLEKIISVNHEFLIDLNTSLLEALLKMLKIDMLISFTDDFEPLNDEQYDWRYRINPGKKSHTVLKGYFQVFDTGKGFIPNLSIIDLIFNMGPESGIHL